MAIERGHSIRLEVCVLWGDSIVHLRSFRRPRSVSLGEGADCDLRVPSSLIGVRRLRIVDFDSTGRAFVHVPATAYAQVVGPERRERSTAYRGGPSTRSHCAEQRIPISIGGTVTMEFGDMSVLITAFEADAALRKTASSMRFWRGQALSFVLHAAALLTMIALGWGDETFDDTLTTEPAQLVRITDAPLTKDLHSCQPWAQCPRHGEHGIPPAPVEAGPVPVVQHFEPHRRTNLSFGETVTVVRPSAMHENEPSADPAPEVSARGNPSRFAVLPTGAALGRVRARGHDNHPPPRVEDLLYAFTQEPVSAIGALPLLTRVDSVPSPYDTAHHFARVVLQAPGKARTARRRVLLVEASTLSQARARRVVHTLSDRLPAGSAITLVSYGDHAQVELEETRDRSVGLLQSVMRRASRRSHDGDSLALAKGLQLAVEAACGPTSAPTDVVLLFEHAVLLSSQSIASLSHQLMSPSCATTTVHAVQLLEARPDRVLDPFPPTKVGLQVHLGPDSDTLELDRLGDPLTTPAVVDVFVEVEFDPDKVLTHRLIGYEDWVNPDPLWSCSWGKERVSSIRFGEQITALYDLRLVPGRAPGLEVRVAYRVPHSPELRRITHRLTSDKTYASPESAPRDLLHAIAVVGFAEYLRNSPYVAASSLDKMLRFATQSNEQGAEFVRLVRTVRTRRDTSY